MLLATSVRDASGTHSPFVAGTDRIVAYESQVSFLRQASYALYQGVYATKL